MNFSLKPISDFVKKVKKRYNEAYDRGQNKSSVKKAKAQIKFGAKDGYY